MSTQKHGKSFPEFGDRAAASFRRDKENAEPTSLIDPVWEELDPNPDIHALFLQFNERFFWSKLLSVEVKWSPRMTLCAGVCSYQRRSHYCSIRLSKPLLQFRPRKDMIETLLHEMIHALLFVTNDNRDHNDHGPIFQSHMKRINEEAGTRITIYHSFHEEVNFHRQHVWRCDGPCRLRPPFFGIVRRAMNRAPGSYDRWWEDHKKTCNGTFIKTSEPEGYADKRKKKTGGEKVKQPKGSSTSQPKKPDKTSPSSGPKQKTLEWFVKKVDGTSVTSPEKAVKEEGDQIANGSACDRDALNRKRDWSKLGVKEAVGTQSKAPRVDPPKHVPSTSKTSVKKPIQSSGPTEQKGPATSKDANEMLPERPAPLVECPSCGEKVEETSINSHLDECLNRELLANIPGVHGSDVHEKSKLDDSVECLDDDEYEEDISQVGSSMPCPICNVMLSGESANAHVDAHFT